MKNLIKIGIIASAAAISVVGSHFNYAEVNNNTEVKEAQFDTLIPVISLNDFYDLRLRSGFVQKLGKAFEDHGFVAIVDVKVDPSILSNAYRDLKEFFAKDLDYKKSIQSRDNNGERGYVTDETPKRQPLHVVDFKEILHIGRGAHC